MNETQVQFKNVADAIRYLLSRGWQLSEKSFYRHISQGKIKDKPWSPEDLDTYAGEYLRPSTATSAPASSSVRLPKGAAAEVLAARQKKLDVETQLKLLELELARGKFITRDEHLHRTCQILLIMKEACLGWIQENACDLITACGGDQARRHEIVDCYRLSFEKYLSRLDTPAPILRDMPSIDDFEDEPILE